MKASFVRVLSVAAAAVLPFVSPGGTNDVDRTDPNFVAASLLIADPGADLCSYLGHACIRLECSTYKLDYCFSYESEEILSNPWRFLAGDLKMGMFSIPTEEYLAANRADRRGVRQYYMNLPPEVKQRLWKLLDSRVAEGINVPYDPLGKSCAVTALRVIAEACLPKKLVIGHWPFKADATMREIVRDHSVGYDWHRFFLCAVFGTEFDKVCDPFDKVIIPADLLSVLIDSTIDGQPVLAAQPVQLLPHGEKHKPPVVTPMMLSLVSLALAVFGFIFNWKWLDVFFITFHAVAGCFLAFLVFGSMLPLNPWNWLLIPFNPLPLVLWHWRRYWAWGFVAVLLAWEAFMLLSPHQLTDHAYLVVVLAYVIFYAKVARKG